jgi:HEAT repeat protein
VRRQAAWALGVIGDSGATAGLIVALKDPDAGVRRQAAWALGVIGK